MGRQGRVGRDRYESSNQSKQVIRRSGNKLKMITVRNLTKYILRAILQYAKNMLISVDTDTIFLDTYETNIAH